MGEEPSHIHFGSLEKQEKERLAALEEQTRKQLEKLKEEKGLVTAPPPKPVEEPVVETKELSASSQAAKERQQQL